MRSCFEFFRWMHPHQIRVLIRSRRACSRCTSRTADLHGATHSATEAAHSASQSPAATWRVVNHQRMRQTDPPLEQPSAKR